MSVLRQARATNIDLFCLADRTFFEDPLVTVTDRDTFPLDLPNARWRRTVEREWVHASPVDWAGPLQGWKVHVAALPANAHQILDEVANHCIRREIAFKHLRSIHVLRIASSKYAARSSSGKFVTIYPRDDTELFDTLDSLDARLSGVDAPYILSDLRWRDGPLHVRYGGFARRTCEGPDGARTLAIEAPDGTLVPDERLPYFTVPAWVELPERLRSGPEPDATARCGYRFESALHHSNGGGVYRGSRTSDGLPVVLKEARPHAGLDAADRDAVGRLEQERDALLALGGVKGTPVVIDSFTLWEHRFLVTAFVEGITLQRWLAVHHPSLRAASTDDEKREYVARALALLDQVRNLVTQLHREGWVHADVHPGNIVVAEDGSVHLIDFELAQVITSGEGVGLGCPGFVRPDRGLTTPITATDDLYALGALALWIFLPLANVVAFDETKALDYIAWAQDTFELPESWERLVADTYRASGTVRGHRSVPAQQGPEIGALVGAVASTASPEREDRLFPGDVVQVLDDGVHFAFGAAGVLWTLDELGVPLDERHVEWIASRADGLQRPGLLDGCAGVGLTLLRTGRTSEGTRAMLRAYEAVLTAADATVYSGRAGVGLAMLACRDAVPDAVDRAVTLADDILTGRVPAAPTSTGVAAGLVDGWAGVAYFLARLARVTRDRRYLADAEAGMRRDLAACTASPDGALLVEEDGLLLPYLAHGSSGLAVAAAELHRADRTVLSDAELTGLVLAMSPELVVEPNLFNGRAGLILALDHLSTTGLADTRRLVRRHERNLAWHTVDIPGGRAFLGRGLRRVSMDVATGTAGVAAVLSAVRHGTAPLPFVDGRRP